MKTPFTTEQFFLVFEKYNSTVFPAQLLLLILGLLMLWLIFPEKAGKDKTVAGILGFLWIWMGAVYHILFFAAINPLANVFGSLFILQGIFLIIEKFGRKNLVFNFRSSFTSYLALFLIVFGIIIYPAISYFMAGTLSHTIWFGLPCPTTIATFGFFMLADKKFSKYLLIIPTFWALIGTTAAMKFGVYQDFMLIVTAIVANIFIFDMRRKKQHKQVA